MKKASFSVEFKVLVLFLALPIVGIVLSKGVDSLMRMEAERVAALPAQTKAAIAEGIRIAQSAKAGDFFLTTEGLLIEVQAPYLAGDENVLTPRVRFCAADRIGTFSFSQRNMTHLRAVLPGNDGLKLRCREQMVDIVRR